MNTQTELAEWIARTYFNCVTHYCWHISGDIYRDCLYYHSPEYIEPGSEDVIVFLKSELDDDEDKEEILKTLENADEKFWEDFKKEYEKLWMVEVGITTAEEIKDIIDDGVKKVVESSNTEKITKYKTILNEFYSALSNAVKTQTPLSYNELEKYLIELYKIAGLDYYDDLELTIEDHMLNCDDYGGKDNCVVNFLMNPYADLNAIGRLELLNELLQSVEKTLAEIENKPKS